MFIGYLLCARPFLGAEVTMGTVKAIALYGCESGKELMLSNCGASEDS